MTRKERLRAELQEAKARERKQSNWIDRLAKWRKRSPFGWLDRRLARAIDRARAEREGTRARIKNLEKRLEDLDRDIVLTPGAPHWGGADDILEREVEPVARRRGLEPNSAKRSETFGNPGSDHHTSQVLASARDFPTANNYALRDEIMRALGVSGSIADYGSYYITRSGARFRVQPIAGTHGTGPHLHIGIRRA